MNVSKLTNNEKALGFTHAFELDYTDFSAAALTSTVNLLAILGGILIRNIALRVDENFDGGATSALTLQVGHDLGTGTDDPDGFITAQSAHADATPLKWGTGNGALLPTSGGYVVPESAGASYLTILATAVGANLDALTQGKVTVLADIVDLAKLARRYEAE